MAGEQVEEIARGQVWTGVQAREIGLVDELGDFGAALAAAKELAGLEPDREYTVVEVRASRHERLPRPFPLLAESDPTAAGLGALLDVLQCLARERVWALAPWMVRVCG